MAKSVVEDCKRLSMKWLKKNGFLQGGFRGGGISWTSSYEGSKSSIGFEIDTEAMYIRFAYSQTDYWTDEKSNMDYRFRLIGTRCTYGGLRYWFICGLSSKGRFCGRKVAKLYKPPGAKWFGCRHCWQLSYYERQQNRGGRFGYLFQSIDMEDKAFKLEEKIKRWHWQGRPTKKHQRLLKYFKQLGINPLLARG